MQSAPKPPDPKQTAAEQFKYGLATEIANREMAAPVVNPFGSYRQVRTGSRTMIGPGGEEITLPTYEERQTLSPMQQGGFDAAQRAQQGALGALGSFLGFSAPSSGFTHAQDMRRPQMDMRSPHETGQTYHARPTRQPFDPFMQSPAKPMKDVTPRDTGSDDGGGGSMDRPRGSGSGKGAGTVISDVRRGDVFGHDRHNHPSYRKTIDGTSYPNTGPPGISRGSATGVGFLSKGHLTRAGERAGFKTGGAPRNPDVRGRGSGKGGSSSSSSKSKSRSSRSRDSGGGSSKGSGKG